MGLEQLLTMTAFFSIKYVAYILVVIAAVLLGKKWGESTKKKKMNLTKE